MSLSTRSELHSGHRVSGSLAAITSFSKRCPHPSHRYSKIGIDFSSVESRCGHSAAPAGSRYISFPTVAEKDFERLREPSGTFQIPGSILAVIKLISSPVMSTRPGFPTIATGRGSSRWLKISARSDASACARTAPAAFSWPARYFLKKT
jgi:hypothetical protein